MQILSNNGRDLAILEFTNLEGRCNFCPLRNSLEIIFLIKGWGNFDLLRIYRDWAILEFTKLEGRCNFCPLRNSLEIIFLIKGWGNFD